MRFINAVLLFLLFSHTLTGLSDPIEDENRRKIYSELKVKYLKYRFFNTATEIKRQNSVNN